MGWFDEQLNIRRAKDDEQFTDAIYSVAGAVMGKRLKDSLNDAQIANSAIEEILKFYQYRIHLDDNNTSFATLDEQVNYYLHPYGIMHREVVLQKGWYKDAFGAILATFTEDGRPVALIPGKISGYYYKDLESGKKVKVTSRNASLIDSAATCFYKPLPMRALKVRDLFVYMLQTLSLSDVAMFIIMAGIVTALGMLGPKINSWLFGDVLISKNISVLVSLAVFMFCYSLARLLLSSYQALINSRLSTKQSLMVQSAVMNRILNLPATFFKKYASGDLSLRADYVESLCGIIYDSVMNVGITTLFSFVYLGQVFQYAPTLVVPSLIFTVVSLVFGLVTTLAQMRITRKKMEVSAQLSGHTYSTISGIQKIKLAGAEKRMFSRWAKMYAREAELTYNPPIFIKVSSAISMTITLLGTLVMYYLAVESKVSVADYYAFNMAYGYISGALASLITLASTFANIKPIMEMAQPIMEATPELSENKQVIANLRGDIEVSNVSFRYNDDMPFVLSDFSLKIKSGEYVAIVGQTGCGKSTLLRLLLGFEKPQKGAIYFDRKDMNNLDIPSLRRKIGTVLQDGKLFLGSIYENVTVSAPGISYDETWEACELASIADDIRKMPMGMHTMICEGQGGISGGQKQRFMIARALASKPKILFFDEATSALDNITQKKVSDAIDSLKCTRVVIAHRLSTIKNADRILFMDNGKITEEGTYEELIAQNGSFAQLVKRQRLDIDCD